MWIKKKQLYNFVEGHLYMCDLVELEALSRRLNFNVSLFFSYHSQPK